VLYCVNPLFAQDRHAGPRYCIRASKAVAPVVKATNLAVIT
jgi:hypothetical protein